MGGETRLGPYWAAFWEWLPGVVAGGLPMVVFLIGATFPSPAERATMDRQFIAHMLILAIANSSVSIMSSFARLLRGEVTNFLTGGRGPLGLMVLTIAILLYVTALYDRAEGGHDGLIMLLMAVGGLVTSLCVSLYLEVAIARLRAAAQRLREGVPSLEIRQGS